MLKDITKEAVTFKIKFILAFTVVILLVFRAGKAAYGSGLNVNFGYDVSLNNLNLTMLNFTGLKTKVITPCQLYLFEINYDFNSNFSLKAGLDWGTVHFGEFKMTEPGIALDDILNQDNIIWKLEGKANFPLSKKIILAGVAGYNGYKTSNVNMVKISNVDPIVMELGQNINGAYVGAELILIMRRWELGASYQMMLNPYGNIQFIIYNNYPLLFGETNSCSLTGLSNSFFATYLQTQLGKKWSVNIGYKIIDTNYSIPNINVFCNTVGLWLKFQYHL